ncbi:hypothetical protein ABI_01220 [Asticcacaulis biprosthecium C19]|uniref:DUF1349 domain-containing protein n=1 Tax=Asticcacaulis biprosthecium C19 TaxID=715226 RepID=F4QHY1_9CAUL|nr:DUF1349 domain-containing protein [Asticcacaulis biprosthecium]EGF91692.1 hypothetical protein ABI_01220 [Asticcacaulis biprosthecium C19]
MATPQIWMKGLPFELTLSEAGHVTMADGELTLTAPKGTDLYNPAGKPAVASAPRLTFTPPAGNFIFAFKAKSDLKAAYDGPGLVVWNGEGYWAKLLFERLPDNTNAVSSNVSTPVGDNSYHFRTEGSVNEIWMKVVRVKTSVFFYVSRDGKTWEILRDFSVDPARPLAIGMFGQSPLGEELTTVFSDIRFESKTIASYWNGE